MSKVAFPSNPANGTIFEAAPGLYYKYYSGSNCWIRIDGVNSLGLATPLMNGLMSKDDYKKLLGLIIPPPQTTLSGDGCKTSFSNGTVALKSSDQSIDVTNKLALMNKVNGETTSEDTEWQIHKNTSGYDFRLNVDKLIEEIESRNLLNRVRLQGKQGAKGDIGDPGIDLLDTGPVGSVGLPGSNSPFPGNLITEDIPLERIKDDNKAIVDITTEEVSDDENYLVVTRANIGNPDSCPSTIIPKDFESSLVVAINQLTGKFVRNEEITSGDCSLICRICASSLHHLDIEPIIEQFNDKFKDRVNRLKAAKEQLVRYWLQAMIGMFNEQKSALCCALENCRSRSRNRDTRQYLETQRIQAAQANFSLVVDGQEDKRFTDMESYKNCPVPASVVGAVSEIDGGLKFTLDSKVHIIDPRGGNKSQSLSGYLKAGTYTAQITGCCADFNQSAGANKFSGRAAILYQASIALGDDSEERISIESRAMAFPDMGEFDSNAAAQNAYNGLTITFEHAGGEVSLWLLDPDGFIENNDGEVEVTILEQTDSSSSATTSVSGAVFIYRNSISQESTIGRISPYSGGLSASDNLGLDSNDVINLSNGPELEISKIVSFLYSGSDGLYFYFIAGANGSQEAEISVSVTILNNTLLTSVVASNCEVRQLSSSEFTASLSVDGEASGFVIGPLDASADYTLTVTPVDFDTMQTWYASGSNQEYLLAEGSSDGIGLGTTTIRPVTTAALFDVIGVPDDFGGESGLLLENYLSNQNVFITRPVTISVVDTRSENDDSLDLQEPLAPLSDDPIFITTDEPDPTPASDPPSVSESESLSEVPEPTKLQSTSECSVNSASDGPITSIVGSITVPESNLETTTEISQDSTITNIVITISSSDNVSLRYVLTDSDGNKFYSKYVDVPTVGKVVGDWQSVSFGAPVLAISPPDIFTSNIISQKTIDTALIADQLSRSQLKKAESLVGLSRLTYIQSIIGVSSSSLLADANKITDIELEFQKMSITDITLGNIKAVVGYFGRTLDYTIDTFDLIPAPVQEDEDEVIGRLKRVVAEINGFDNFDNGLLYNKLTSYWGDYTGVDFMTEYSMDFNGNNFFTINSIRNNKLTQITDTRGFKDLLENLNTRSILYGGGAKFHDIVVNDFGVVYVADGTLGAIYAIYNINLIFHWSNGDASDMGTNQLVTIVDGLPTGVQPVITLGRKFQDGVNMMDEIIANFGGQWFRVTGVGAIMPRHGRAVRDDITTDRCCLFNDFQNYNRMVAIGSIPTQFGDQSKLSNGLAGNSLTTNKRRFPQPSSPVPFTKLDLSLVDDIQAELDSRGFNTFDYFAIDGKILYKVFPTTGTREIFRDLGEEAFGLKVNPYTLDLYFIANDRGTTTFSSGTIIKRVDINDFDGNGNPKIKTVWSISDSENAALIDRSFGIFAIEFGNIVPPDPTMTNQALYALVSRLEEPTGRGNVLARLIEISETPVPPPPGPDPSNRVPTNSLWSVSADGGINQSGPGANANPIIFTPITPTLGCQMFYKQVQWYERGWRIGACCGALVQLDGDWWIVVKRSIGVDLSCGGGESANNVCIQQFIDYGEGHPAIAWPTSAFNDDGGAPGGGGEEFLGLPSSGFVNFVKNDTLSEQILNVIKNGQATVIKGNPGTEIPFILFPQVPDELMDDFMLP